MFKADLALGAIKCFLIFNLKITQNIFWVVMQISVLLNDLTSTLSLVEYVDSTFMKEGEILNTIHLIKEVVFYTYYMVLLISHYFTRSVRFLFFLGSRMVKKYILLVFSSLNIPKNFSLCLSCITPFLCQQKVGLSFSLGFFDIKTFVGFGTQRLC